MLHSFTNEPSQLSGPQPHSCLTSYSRPAPWAPEIHRGIHLLKSTVDLSFGRMCPVLRNQVLGKQTLRWRVLWRLMRTHPCKDMRRTWGAEGKAHPQGHQPRPPCGELYCWEGPSELSQTESREPGPCILTSAIIGHRLLLERGYSLE